MSARTCAPGGAILAALLLTSPLAPGQGSSCGASVDCERSGVGPAGCWNGPYVWDCAVNPTPGSVNPEMSQAALIPRGPYRGHVVLWHHNGVTQAHPTTWVWLLDPARPEELTRIVEPLASNIFCAGMAWDPEGRLLIAGGGGAFTPFLEVYRFLPEELVWPPRYAGADPCRPSTVAGSPFELVGSMSIERFYPTVITLQVPEISTNQPAPRDRIPGGAALVMGGDVPGHQVGNDFLQAVSAGVAGQAALSHTLRAESGGLPLPGGLPFEAYERLPDAAEPEPRLDYYPRAFQLASTGGGPASARNVFVANDVAPGLGGPNDLDSNEPGASWVLKPRYDGSQTAWEMWPGPDGGAPGERFYGSACLLHMREGSPAADGRNRVLLFGGRHGRDPGTFGLWSAVQELRIPAGAGAEEGEWVTKDHATLVPRYYNNAVVLPTGDVLLVGGGDGVSAANGRTTSFATCPELYRPGDAGLPGGASSVLLAARPDAPGADVPYPRLYHAVALLLADGRVLVTGGHEYDGFPEAAHTAEIFSPPYIGDPARPTIHSLSADELAFGQVFGVVVDHDAERPVDGFALVRPGTVTHHFDNGQRYIELDFTAVSVDPDAGTALYRVTAPADDLGPPGYYMLFALRTGAAPPPLERLPSEARFVRLSS